RDSILSNAMEAVIGAVYLDGGYPAAEKVVLPWVRTQELKQDSGDYKSRLQEFIQKRTRSVPDYEVLQTVGPEHDKIFTVAVSLDGKRLGVGKGRNKKLAEQDAARDAYRHLKK
ncbi:MAG: ribonuclease III, partial [Elusimicrobiaceae bacterium]|nr:ribonuclease III [Elusimicrobiaceae bacterium]